MQMISRSFRVVGDERCKQHKQQGNVFRAAITSLCFICCKRDQSWNEWKIGEISPSYCIGVSIFHFRDWMWYAIMKAENWRNFLADMWFPHSPFVHSLRQFTTMSNLVHVLKCCVSFRCGEEWLSSCIYSKKTFQILKLIITIFFSATSQRDKSLFGDFSNRTP